MARHGEKKGKYTCSSTPYHLVARFYQPLELNLGLSISRCTLASGAQRWDTDFGPTEKCEFLSTSEFS